MRKFAIIAVLVLGFAIVASAATSLSWKSDSRFSGTAPDVWDWNGDVITTGENLYLQLFNTSESWEFSGDRTAGELASTTTPVMLMDGVVYATIPEIYPWGSGVEVGTRMYDTADPSSATRYAESSLTTTLPSLEGDPDLDPVSTDYNLGEINQQDWVPEPTTTMLALAGICTVIYRRRRMSK